METTLELKPSPSAGNCQKKFFQAATQLSEEGDESITEALRTTVKKNPKVFVAYLVEIGVLDQVNAAAVMEAMK